MSDFSTPFGNDSDRRTPTAQELMKGFECGPADREIFNFLVNRLEAELASIIADSGLTPVATDRNTLLLSLRRIIARDTGTSPDTEYLLYATLKDFVKIYPEIETPGNLVTITVSADNREITIDEFTVVHRGMKRITVPETTLDIFSGRTYHLRWNETDGVTVTETNDADYNPDGLDEDDVKFDTTYDDLLLARIVVSGTGVPTITRLRNDTKMIYNGPFPNSMYHNAYSDGSTTVAITISYRLILNYSRNPSIVIAPGLKGIRDFTDPTVGLSLLPISRYGADWRHFLPQNQDEVLGRPYAMYVEA